MSTQDYIALGMLLIQLVSALRLHKFTVSSVEKTLSRNRNLLGTVLRDIVSKFTEPTPKPSAPAMMLDVEPAATTPAHMQAGADV